MRIGLDFDNTIANYEGVFQAAALERGIIPEGLGASKNAVRDYLNGSGQNDAFTELQGYVYGARMDLASPYPHAREVIAGWVAYGHEVFVVSHKTRQPIIGPAYDMHAAARGFLMDQGLVGAGMIAPENVHFLLTKREKIAHAAALAVDVFVDDLPEILAMAGWPQGCRRILFDPHGKHYPASGVRYADSWQAIAAVLAEA